MTNAPLWEADIAPFVYHGTLTVAPPGGDLVLRGSGGIERDLWQRCCYAWWHCLEGTVVLSRGDESWSVRPGRVGLSEPGMHARLTPGTRANRLIFDLLHRPRLNSGAHRYTMAQRTAQPSWQQIFGRALTVLFPDPQDRMLGLMVDRLCNTMKGPAFGMRAQALLATWLADLLDDTDQSPVGGSFADQVERLMQRHMREHPTLDQIAQRLGICRQTVHRRFLAERGCSPNQALDRLRLERAFQVLSAGTGSTSSVLQQAVRSCGFSEASTFGRWFKRQTGLTPSRWRSQVPGLPYQSPARQEP